MDYTSVPTRGRTLDYAAGVYDILEPWVMFGKQNKINRQVVEFLDIKAGHKILDMGCGTGVVTQLISRRLSSEQGGMAVGIDAAGKMIEGAVKKRASDTCRFKVAAAETLPFENESFDSVVSTLFFHHIQLDLKEKAFAEAFRVLKPGGTTISWTMNTRKPLIRICPVMRPSSVLFWISWFQTASLLSSCIKDMKMVNSLLIIFCWQIGHPSMHC